ncbi:unnamed protein product [Clavelina lepadiformis]|uniref:Uncharacterized protein n=1 Tax=Clavelina lepadiformis TaxID=159417 RepID=A0ABP0H229_CLALP
MEEGIKLSFCDPSDLELSTNMTTRAERKSKRVYGKWDEEAMRHAIEVVRDGTMGTKKQPNSLMSPKRVLLED